LKSKEVVFITGGGSGIGRLMAINFAKEGCSKIVLWDLNSKGLESVSQEVKSVGGDVYTYLCDVSNREMVYQIADKVKKKLEKLIYLLTMQVLLLEIILKIIVMKVWKKFSK